SLKLYADATPVEVPPPPGGTSSVVVSVSDRKATLVLEGMLFTGSADSQLNLFKSDDGQVTASFSPDLQTATVKIGNRVMTFGQCLPRMSN
ncbi:MAG TPA: hypothetical protein VN132_15615, partial [Bdellovibrio sp.]|nr:hypothetical protein [Bdellovibrio sp.]